MNRRIIAIVLIVLGLSTVGAAIASATAWKPPTTVTVPLPSEPTVNYVITDPGVLNIVNPTVQVKAIAEDEDSPVFLAMGRTDEVQAWVESSDYGRVTGLDSWEELSYTTEDAVPGEDDGGDDADEGDEEEPLADPATSDMWVEEVNGIGEATYTWEETPGRWSMIVATDGSSPAPTLEFTWEREVPTPALIPGIILGAVVTVLGVILLLAGLKKRKEAPALDDAVLDDAALDDVEEVPEQVEEPSEDDISPEEIMADLEGATEDEPASLVEEPSYDDADLGELDEEYPHMLGVGQTQTVVDEPVAQGPEADADERPLTRREIRERERLREREAALRGESAQQAGAQWPTQDDVAEPAGQKEPRRRWWQRKQEDTPPPVAGPIVIDDDTGEIIITGEIDVSNLTPQASADSWRATWGLDKDTQTRWVPVIKREQEDEGEENE